MRRAGRLALAVIALVPAAWGVAGCGGDDRLAVLPLGDSITYGVTAGGDVPGGYRAPLADDLDEQRVPVRYVGTSLANPGPEEGGKPDRAAHDGWPGARIDEIDASLQGATALDGGHWIDGTPQRAGLRPDVVVVHLGTNDIGQRYDPPGTISPGTYVPTDPAQRALLANHVADRLALLVGHLHALLPRTAFVVCTIGPSADPTAADYSAVVRDRVVPGLAASGVRVALADVGGALAAAGPSQLSADGVHPTAAGYRTMAAAIAPAVAQVAAAG